MLMYSGQTVSSLSMLLSKCISASRISGRRICVASPDSMKNAVKELLDKCGSYPNFILSSGCDIPASASWDNINAFFEALKD